MKFVGLNNFSSFLLHYNFDTIKIVSITSPHNLFYMLISQICKKINICLCFFKLSHSFVSKKNYDVTQQNSHDSSWNCMFYVFIFVIGSIALSLFFAGSEYTIVTYYWKQVTHHSHSHKIRIQVHLISSVCFKCSTFSFYVKVWLCRKQWFDIQLYSGSVNPLLYLRVIRWMELNYS